MQKTKTLRKIGTWLASDLTGQSSMAMCSVYLGGNPKPVHHPHDAWDLIRCLRFLDLLPSNQRMPLLDLMAARSPEWRKIKQNWFEIIKIWNDEKWKAQYPKLHAKMSSLLH